MNVDLVITDRGVACLLCSGDKFPDVPQTVRYFSAYGQIALYFDKDDCDGQLLEKNLNAQEYADFFSHLKNMLIGRIEDDEIVEEFDVPFQYVPDHAVAAGGR